jgi:hypothetical protein
MALLLLLASGAIAQEHAYEPGKAFLAHATAKWLVWEPDDKGPSQEKPKVEPKKKDGEFDVPEDLAKQLKELEKDKGTLKRVFVLQPVADKSKLRKVVVKWKIDGQQPRRPSPLTVLDNGTLITADREGYELGIHPPDGDAYTLHCFVKNRSGVAINAYPDGVVVQTPKPDRPLRRMPQYETASLYWVPWGGYGLDSDQAKRMTYGKGVTTAFALRVARFDDQIAMPGGVYSIKGKRRKRWSSKKSTQSIHAFDGKVAFGGDFTYAVRKKDTVGMQRDRDTICVRNGVAYYLVDAGGVLRLRACDLKRPKKTKTLGQVVYEGETRVEMWRSVRASTLARQDPRSKTRFTIYWTGERIVWSSEDGWRFRKLLTTKDFGK